MDTALADRLASVDARINDAARDAGRDPAEITRIVVTKFHPASLITDLYALGVRDVGENRQQELTAKRRELGALEGLRWHFIGQAQTNKARAVRAAADVVHSVDRPRIADALDAAGDGAVLDVLLQVNLTDDPGRGGVVPAEAEALAAHVASLGTLRLRGVMAVAPLDEEPAPAFARLRACADEVRRVVPDATWISAGMTGDFPEAVAMGATHLRIGSAITGPRPARD
ncbi:YggS family pyridoxal phosphate enzyme [Microbacterium sp. CSI-V]|uniref:YggS family pyridoxal phosphate-dependent enzyme n=1 Tax=unclassified Microbacterium TaxID=2609290 RepID=UPI00097CB3E6|nr:MULTISPECIES: YggS family pyridoxal phosphate-dependent enzyme [unclassified Microbacterium]MXS73096.1 YggS family pyridoxal phosphate-dependent enzyme [Microbacterium sp. TL13]ONI66023.1 YggS family pyridoxal phosphate enzyme [Microbacterium sp. CSI-V]